MTDTTPIPEGALTVDDAPIPAGALTVDNEPKGYMFAIRVDGEAIAWCTNYGRARLLAHQPDRPTGVPDDAPEARVVAPNRQALIDLADRLDQLDREHPDERTIIVDLAAVAEWRDRIRSALGVPPYQPTPDPADSPPDATHADHYRTCNCLADSAECCRPSCTCHAHPSVATGKRTGPLGLSEEATRDIAARWRNMGGGSLSGILAAEAMGDACRAAVAEWDAEPQPVETLDDIVADMRKYRGVSVRSILRWADQIEAATRPDPDTITVNLPEWVVRKYAKASADGRLSGESIVIFGNACRAALAAAGLPQEPTEGGDKVTTRAALETLADRTNPICDACDQPITDPEPCDQHVNGHTVFFHPDCCPECQENDT